MLKCMFCGSNLNWQCDYDAPDMGYDCEGIVGCYMCTNEKDCGMFFEIIDLFPDENSKCFETYEERFIKYYNLKDFE